MLYVYAIVPPPAGGRAPEGLPAGLRDETLRVVVAGRVAAVVGAMDERPAPDPDVLRRQDAVVRALSSRESSLLPARFASAVLDEQALRAWLEPRQDALAEALALVEGCEQMTIRYSGPAEAAGSPETSAPPHPPPDRSPRADPPTIDLAEGALATGPGTRYLEERRRRLAEREEPKALAPLREALRSLVRAERLEVTSPGRGALHHLLPRGEAAAYRERIASVEARLRPVQVTASGPWAPYAFAPEELS
jgi:hypothetical protein